MDKDFLILPMVFVFWGWIAWFIVTAVRRQKTAKLQTELRGKLLDRLGSSPETLSYLQSDAGKQFLEPLTGGQRTAQARIVSAIEISAILVVFGAALLLLRSLAGGSGQTAYLVFGTLAVALGIGFALAGAASYFLSKSLGLLEGGIERRQ